MSAKNSAPGPQPERFAANSHRRGRRTAARAGMGRCGLRDRHAVPGRHHGTGLALRSRDPVLGDRVEAGRGTARQAEVEREGTPPPHAARTGQTASAGVGERTGGIAADPIVEKGVVAARDETQTDFAFRRGAHPCGPPRL